MEHTFNREQVTYNYIPVNKTEDTGLKTTTRNTWFIDLPEFLEAGLGGKGNLMMVAGADTLLDILSEGKDTVKIHIETTPYEGYTHKLIQDTTISDGFNAIDVDVLTDAEHPNVAYGGNYIVEESGHKLWLCPVAEYVFNGVYPEEIYIHVVKV